MSTSSWLRAGLQRLRLRRPQRARTSNTLRQLFTSGGLDAPGHESTLQAITPSDEPQYVRADFSCRCGATFRIADVSRVMLEQVPIGATHRGCVLTMDPSLRDATTMYIAREDLGNRTLPPRDFLQRIFQIGDHVVLGSVLAGQAAPTGIISVIHEQCDRWGVPLVTIGVVSLAGTPQFQYKPQRALHWARIATAAVSPLTGTRINHYSLYGDHGLTCRAVLPPTSQRTYLLADFTCRCGLTARLRLDAALTSSLRIGDEWPDHCFLSFDYDTCQELLTYIAEEDIGHLEVPARDVSERLLQQGDAVQLGNRQRNVGLLGYVLELQPERDAWGMQYITVLGGDGTLFRNERGYSWWQLEPDSSAAQTIRTAVESGQVRDPMCVICRTRPRRPLDEYCGRHACGLELDRRTALAHDATQA